jgi:hypothetical protein
VSRKRKTVYERSAIEQLEDLQPYLDAAQKAAEELGRSPLLRAEGASELLLDPELCADVIRENLCAVDGALHAAAETLKKEPRAPAPPAENPGIAACMRLNAKLTERVAELIEALAPFANRAVERRDGTECSALTDQQWRRALETYQECPGGDMCGCEPQ